MKTEKSLSLAVRWIALAHVFILMDVNLNSFNLLPEWIGYVLICCQLDTVARAEESAELLKPLAAGLAFWDGLTWLAPELGSVFGSFIPLVAGVVSLYFHFQLLTNLANIADRKDTGLGEKLRKLRTAQTLFITALRLPWSGFTAESFVLALLVVLAQTVILVWETKMLYDLARTLEEKTE